MIRHRVATLGRPGPAWPRAIARWGSGATLPLDTTTCVSAEELRALLETATVDLAIVEAGMPGVDRVLADAVRRAGAALAVVDGPGLDTTRDRLEPDAILAADFDPEALAAVLHGQARRRPGRPPQPVPADDPQPLGRLVAVTGPPGVGASTVAQALAAHHTRQARTLLADLALDADQHLRHGVRPGHDGVFELAEALRHAPPADLVPPTADLVAGYDLLCGLRRRQEWTALSTVVADHVIEVLRRSHPLVVADVPADLDGRAESGSLDLEERNALARATLPVAAVVVVVGRWTTTGVHRLVRTLVDLNRHGIDHDRLQPVLNDAPTSAVRQALACRTLGALLTEVDGGPWRDPACLAHDRGVEACVREARSLPARFVRRVGHAVGIAG
ncbi:MAG TPA: hypothetical protein VIT24_11210 [Acidimicrobiales bacterium]